MPDVTPQELPPSDEPVEPGPFEEAPVEAPEASEEADVQEEADDSENVDIDDISEKLDRLQEAFETIKAREAEISQAKEELKMPRRIQNLMKSSGFRRAVEKALRETGEDEFDWGETGDEASTQAFIDKFLDPRVDELQEKFAGIQNIVFEMMSLKYRNDLDNMAEAYHAEHAPDMKPQEWAKLWREVEETAAKRYGEALTMPLLEDVANGLILKKVYKNGTNGQAAQVLKTLKDQPRGSRLVTGPASRKQTEAPSGPVKKMSDQDIVNLLTQTLKKG